MFILKYLASFWPTPVSPVNVTALRGFQTQRDLRCAQSVASPKVQPTMSFTVVSERLFKLLIQTQHFLYIFQIKRPLTFWQKTLHLLTGLLLWNICRHNTTCNNSWTGLSKKAPWGHMKTFPMRGAKKKLGLPWPQVCRRSNSNIHSINYAHRTAHIETGYSRRQRKVDQYENIEWHHSVS